MKRVSIMKNINDVIHLKNIIRYVSIKLTSNGGIIKLRHVFEIHQTVMKKRSKILGFTLLSLALFCQCDSDDTPNPNPNPGGEPVEATTTLINTLSIPWELTWGPDNFLWVTERSGKISRINPDTGEQDEILVIDEVEQVQESGLLGLVHHPDFESNPYIYVVYT